MKKLIAFVLVLMFAFAITANAEPVTIREWIDAGGCEGTLTVTIGEILNPVWAVVEDETASVHLFGIYHYDGFYCFGESGFQTGDKIVISNPLYNEFEGTVEMTDAQLQDVVVNQEGYVRTSIQDWLAAEGAIENCVLVVKVMEVLNLVLASVADETGTVNLFGVQIDGEFTPFEPAGINSGDLLVLVNPRYNVFEGNVEAADAMLYRCIKLMQGDE